MTRVTVKKNHLTSSEVTGNFLTCPGCGWNPGMKKRQLAVSGNASDHSVIRAELLTRLATFYR